MKVYLIRHGQTRFNALRILQGSEINEPLDEVGFEQAIELGEQLKGKGITHIFTSDLDRAYQTADLARRVMVEDSITKEAPVPITMLPGLNERSFAGAAGKRMRIVNKEHEGRSFAESLGAETDAELEERLIRTWREQIVPRCIDTDTIALVCHGGVMDTYIKHFNLPGPRAEASDPGFVHKNASVVSFDFPL